MKTLYAAIAALLVAGNVSGQDSLSRKTISLNDFALGDNIAKYEGRLSKSYSPLDTMPFGVHYDYAVTDVKDVLGYPIKFINLGFCSGKLINADFFLGDITDGQSEQLHKQIIEWLGKPNSISSMQSDLNTTSPLEQKSWSWGNRDVSLSYGYLKSGPDKLVSPSLLLRSSNLTGQCMAREKSLSIQKQP